MTLYRPQRPPQETVDLPRCHGRDLVERGPCWRVPDTDKVLPNGTMIYDHYCLSCREQIKARTTINRNMAAVDVPWRK